MLLNVPSGSRKGVKTEKKFQTDGWAEKNPQKRILLLKEIEILTK